MRADGYSLLGRNSTAEDFSNSTVFEIPETIESTVTQEDYEHFLMSQAASVGVCMHARALIRLSHW
jgi:hypothetical protein